MPPERSFKGKSRTLPWRHFIMSSSVVIEDITDELEQMSTEDKASGEEVHAKSDEVS